MRWRRRYPLVVALVVNVLGSFSTAASGAVVVTTVSLATRRRWREIVPVAVVGFIASVVFFETHPGAEDSLLFSLLFTVVFVSARDRPRHVHRRPPRPAGHAAGTSRPRRTRAGPAGRAGAGDRAGPDRPRDARRAGTSTVAGGVARRCTGVLPGAERRRGGQSGRHHPAERPPRPGGPARDPRSPAAARDRRTTRASATDAASTFRRWSRRPRVPARESGCTTRSTTWRGRPTRSGAARTG